MSREADFLQALVNKNKQIAELEAENERLRGEAAAQDNARTLQLRRDAELASRLTKAESEAKIAKRAMGVVASFLAETSEEHMDGELRYSVGFDWILGLERLVGEWRDIRIADAKEGGEGR